MDAYAGDGLDAALDGADALVDVTNTQSQNEGEIVDFFGTITANALAAEKRVGVQHHVLLSIVGIDHNQRVPHYAGKREQERRVAEGSVPWSIVRATQFHDFAAMVASWALRDGAATIAPLLVQPIAQHDVGGMLAEVVTGQPLRRSIDIAGPHTEDLVDMARRTFSARGEQVRLVPELARDVRQVNGWRGTAAERRRSTGHDQLRRVARRRRPLNLVELKPDVIASTGCVRCIQGSQR